MECQLGNLDCSFCLKNQMTHQNAPASLLEAHSGPPLLYTDRRRCGRLWSFYLVSTISFPRDSGQPPGTQVQTSVWETLCPTCTRVTPWAQTAPSASASAFLKPP